MEIIAHKCEMWTELALKVHQAHPRGSSIPCRGNSICEGQFCELQAQRWLRAGSKLGIEEQAWEPGGRVWPERAIAGRSLPVQDRSEQSQVGRGVSKGRLWVTHLGMDPTPPQPVSPPSLEGGGWKCARTELGSGSGHPSPAAAARAAPTVPGPIPLLQAPSCPLDSTPKPGHPGASKTPPPTQGPVLPILLATGAANGFS